METCMASKAVTRTIILIITFTQERYPSNTSEIPNNKSKDTPNYRDCISLRNSRLRSTLRDLMVHELTLTIWRKRWTRGYMIMIYNLMSLWLAPWLKINWFILYLPNCLLISCALSQVSYLFGLQQRKYRNSPPCSTTHVLGQKNLEGLKNWYSSQWIKIRSTIQKNGLFQKSRYWKRYNGTVGCV